MAEKTGTNTQASSSATSGSTTGQGQNTSTSSTAVTGGASGANVVAPPLDAKPNEPQSSTPAVAAPGEQTLGAADTGNAQAEAADAKQTPESAGFALKVTVSNHTHEGQPVKKGSTIMVDVSTYRWALENKIGEPGNKEDVGLDVTKKGETIKPESDAEAVARLEAEYAAKQQAKAENDAAEVK